MRKAIGIDLGTTSISGVVLDIEENKILEKCTISGGHFLETGYAWERIQDPEEIVEKARQMLDSFLEKHPDAETIGTDCQMHGVLYVDQDGNAISPLFTWQDGRGDVKGENGKNTIQEILELTGEKTASGYGLVTHIYNIKHNQVPNDAVMLCTIGDYLTMKLTGRKNPIMHVSNAASLGLFDCEKGCFYEEKLKKLGMDIQILSPVVWDVPKLGEYQGKEVFISIGDNQASYLGAAGLSNKTVLVNIGTGSQVSVLTEKYTKMDRIDTRPLGKGKWLLVGASLCGGRAYALLETFFRTYLEAAMTLNNGKEINGKEINGKEINGKEINGKEINGKEINGKEINGKEINSKETVIVEKQYSVMEFLAREAMEKNKDEKLSVSTLFSGTRENPLQRGSITEIGTENFTPGNLIAGTMEGMVKELVQLYECMCSDSEIQASKLVMSGNGLRQNKILQQIVQEIFLLPSSISEFEEEAACGAALTPFFCQCQYHSMPVSFNG